MSEQKKPFRFLTTDQLSRLTYAEKLAYIDRAIEVLKARGESFRVSDRSEPNPEKDQDPKGGK